MGMKLEAIRVDRTRGGRSTYPFTYTIPPSNIQSQHSGQQSGMINSIDNKVKQEERVCRTPPQEMTRLIPPLLQVSKF